VGNNIGQTKRNGICAEERREENKWGEMCLREGKVFRLFRFHVVYNQQLVVRSFVFV